MKKGIIKKIDILLIFTIIFSILPLYNKNIVHAGVIEYVRPTNGGKVSGTRTQNDIIYTTSDTISTVNTSNIKVINLKTLEDVSFSYANSLVGEPMVRINGYLNGDYLIMLNNEAFQFSDDSYSTPNQTVVTTSTVSDDNQIFLDNKPDVTDAGVPQVVNTYPLNGGYTKGRIIIEFDRFIDSSALSTSSTGITIKDGENNVSIVKRRAFGRYLVIDIDPSIPEGRLLTVQLADGVVKDFSKQYSSSAYPAAGASSYKVITNNAVAPSIVSSNIINNQLNVNTDANIVLTFSEDILVNDLSKVTLKNSTTNMNVPFKYTVNGKILTIDPDVLLDESASYIFSFGDNITYGSETVRDPYGNYYTTATPGSAYGFTFNTVQADTTAPIVTTTNPTNGQVDVAVQSEITMTFSENIQIKEASLLTLKKNGVTVNADYTVNGNILSINPVGDMEKESVYTVSIGANSIADMQGNFMGNEYTFSFNTVLRPTVGFEITSSNNKNLLNNTKVDFDINIDVPLESNQFSGGVSNVAVEVVYDPNVLEFVSGAPGTANGINILDFENTYAKVDNSNKPIGVVVIKLSSQNNGITNDGLFYKLSFKSISVPVKGKTNIMLRTAENPDGTAIDSGLNRLNTVFLPAIGIDVLFNIIYGDVNGDNVVNNIDLILIKRAFSTQISMGSLKNRKAVDVNGDGNENNIDLTLYKRYFSKKIIEFPVK